MRHILLLIICILVLVSSTPTNPKTPKPTRAPKTKKPTSHPTFKPTILSPTTLSPTTSDPTTIQPTTAEPTTVEPTTVEPTTAGPTTVEPTTAEPTTAEPTTVSPTTAMPTTSVPTTASPTRTPEPTVPPVPKQLYPQDFSDSVRVEMVKKGRAAASQLKIETECFDVGTGVNVSQRIEFAAPPLNDKNATKIRRDIEDVYKILIDSTTDLFDPALWRMDHGEWEVTGDGIQFCDFGDAGPTVTRRRLISGGGSYACYYIDVKYNGLQYGAVSNNAPLTRHMFAHAPVSHEIALDTENYVKIADNWTNRAILCAVLFWVVCGPFALVWAVMKYQKKKSYQKVAAFVDTETEDDSK